MQGKVFLLFSIFLLGLSLLCQGSITYASGVSKVNEDEALDYFFIHYNGGKHEITINENVILTLINWADDSKSSVNGRVEYQMNSTNLTKDINLIVSQELNNLVITENESINYRINVSESFKYENLTPLKFIDQSTVVEQNENGTSIEERKTIDEYGTVIESKGFTYLSTDENNQKTVSTKEEYHSINSQVIVSTNAETANNTLVLNEEAVPELSQTVSTYSVDSVEALAVEEPTLPTLQYRTHIQNIGWQDFVTNGGMSGTEGEAKRLESIEIDIESELDLGIKYATHVQDLGWLNYVSDGQPSGTTGKAKRLEAIKIELTGVNREEYDIYYRVHAETYGWLGWAKNGDPAGTEGQSKRLEAIEIVLVEKGKQAQGSTENPFLKKPTVVYSTHVQDYGWLDEVKDGVMNGTEGQAKRLEAIKINVSGFSGGIIYSTHVQDFGWLNNVSNGEMSGTSGKSKRMEAIIINLTGDIGKYFDVYYRVHIETYGWLGWAKNGMKAGSEGLSKRLEAIEIKLVPKGQGEAVNEKEAYKKPLIVFIDPGHGGYDPGATAGGYEEEELNLSVAKKVQSLLKYRGYIVYMSRNSDTTVDLYDRPQMANDLGADIFVSIHHNSSTSSSPKGIESYYYKYNEEYNSKINTEMHNNPIRVSRSITLTNLIHKNMVDYTGAIDRGTDGKSFAVVRESAMPATLLELGYINNSSERQYLITNSYQFKLAKAIADGIDEYFNIYY